MQSVALRERENAQRRRREARRAASRFRSCWAGDRAQFHGSQWGLFWTRTDGERFSRALLNAWSSRGWIAQQSLDPELRVVWYRLTDRGRSVLEGAL